MALSKELSDKLNRMGINPDSMKQKLQNYIGTQGQAFATPQEYASEIQRKQRAGVPLDDPQTARLMRQIMPQSFGEKPMTTFAFPGASPDVRRAQQTLMPQIPRTAQSMLEAVMRHQQANPISIPHAPGTPTLATRQAEEAMRAQAAQEALAQEKWTWQQEQAELERQMAERKFAADQAHREWQKQQANSQPDYPQLPPWQKWPDVVQSNAMQEIDALIEEVAKTGGKWGDIESILKGKAAQFKADGVAVEDVIAYAADAYEQATKGRKIEPSTPPLTTGIFPGLDMLRGVTGEIPYRDPSFDAFRQAGAVSDTARVIAEQYNNYYSPEQIQSFMDQGTTILKMMLDIIPMSNLLAP